MRNKIFLSASRLIGTAIFAVACAADAQIQTSALALKPQAASRTTAATHAPLLGAARAGKRIVAVGDFGTIVLSDDNGKTFRQAAAVPVSSTLTAVSFADERNGWAVGHWGVVLNTRDGGDHWSLQRLDIAEDRPIFSVHFIDAQEGIAAGLWSLLLATHDGGRSWHQVQLGLPPDGGKADRNLFKIFASSSGALFIAAERGMVLKSDDRGRSWRYLDTGYKGSFWSGVALKDGQIIVAGLRGTIYKSGDGGQTWRASSSGTKSSITDLIEVNDRVVAVGLDGVELESFDGGNSFAQRQREDRLSFTAVSHNGAGGLVFFSKKGVIDAPTSSIAVK